VIKNQTIHSKSALTTRRMLPCIVVLMMVIVMQKVSANEDALDFGFIKDPPGQLVAMGPYRLHVTCVGNGDVTVLFEAGLGGSSLEWGGIQEALSQQAVTCSYDRAGYAWSDPSPYPRTASQLAREAARMLTKLKISGPLLLVGHSFGGFVIRELALRTDLDVVGMVLVDASHEDQLVELEGKGKTRVMPSTGNFVLKAVDVPENFPEVVRRKIQALGRMRKTYAATHGEMSEFRRSTDQVREHRQQVDYPIIVLTRGIDPFPDTPQGREKNTIWNKLQDDLALLSKNGKRVTAERSGHHIHADEPELVISSIEAILDEYQKNR